MNLLNLGCGPDQWPDPWWNVDPDPRWRRVGNGCRFVRANPSTGLPWADGFFAGAVALHVIQHVDQHRAIDWLAEVRRVVAGPVRVGTPDIVSAFDAYQLGDTEWFPCDGATVDDRLCTYLSQNGANRSQWTVRALIDAMTAAGFVDARRVAPGGTFAHPGHLVAQELAARDNRPGESIFVEAWSP